MTRLNAEMVTALNAAEVRARLDDKAMAVIGGTPEEFAALLRTASSVTSAIVKAAGIRLE